MVLIFAQTGTCLIRTCGRSCVTEKSIQVSGNFFSHRLNGIVDKVVLQDSIESKLEILLARQ